MSFAAEHFGETRLLASYVFHEIGVRSYKWGITGK